MNRTLKDLMNESFADSTRIGTAVRVLRQSDQQGERGLRYVPMTYAQLREQRDRLASGLARAGYAKGDRVGILTDGGLEPVLIFLAADMLGLSSVPLCNKLPDDILKYMIEHSGLEVLFLDSRSREQVDRILPTLAKAPKLILTEGQSDEIRSFFALVQDGARGASARRGNLPGRRVEGGLHLGFVGSAQGRGTDPSQPGRQREVGMGRDFPSRTARSVQVGAGLPYHGHPEYLLSPDQRLDAGSLRASPDRVLVDIRYSEPHGFLTVPLILDKVYGNVRKEIDAGGVKGKLVERAVRAKRNITRGEASISDKAV